MKQKKTLYIIPGLGETARAKNYREISKAARNHGLKVVPVKIGWDLDKPFSEFVKEADEQIPDDIPNDYVLGFSFGAFITALLAKKKCARGYFFCSISPYFKEDLKNIPQESKDYFGEIFMQSLGKYSFPKNALGQAWFFVGKNDWESAVKRSEISFEEWRGEKKIFLIEDAGHELSNSQYEEKVVDVIESL